MLPRPQRLTRSAEFTAVMSHGSRGTSGRITAHVAPAASTNSRVGLIVGKNVGNSVQRHRVSRVLRHAMPEVFRSVPTKVDVVLRALPGAAKPGRDLATEAAVATRKAVARL